VKLFVNTALLLFALLSVLPSLLAQAWLFPKGGGTVTLSYQNIFVRDHVDGTGKKFDLGHMMSSVMSVDTDYSITDRLAIKVGIPYVATKYYGAYPHQLSVDDGKYHSTFQDFNFEARYNLTNRSVVVTPFFKVGIPSHSYEYFAHAAVGKDQREYRVGANVGRRLDPIIPKAYIQGRYAFGVSQPILNIAMKRSYTEFQYGHFLTPRVTLLGSGQWLHSHTGGNADFSALLAGDPYGGLPPAVWPHHDQLGKSTMFDISGGTAVTLSRSIDFFVSVGRSLKGTSGHVNSAVVTIGISRSFGTHFETATSPDGPGPSPDSAFVCTCPKLN
jgi:hypothetical protein